MMSNKGGRTDSLEQALLERATRLAQEYLQRAEQQREDIHRDSHEKLQLGEERELLYAREKADRLYQRNVQASELRLQAKLDNLRWELIEQLLDDLLDKLSLLAENENDYYPVLQDLFQETAQLIETGNLVVYLNQHDRQRLSENNCRILNEWVPDRKIILSDEAYECRGGVLVYDEDFRVRVDNTFEGRVAAFRAQLEQVIMEHLFSKTLSTGEMLHG